MTWYKKAATAKRYIKICLHFISINISIAKVFCFVFDFERIKRQIKADLFNVDSLKESKLFPTWYLLDLTVLKKDWRDVNVIMQEIKHMTYFNIWRPTYNWNKLASTIKVFYLLLFVLFQCSNFFIRYRNHFHCKNFFCGFYHFCLSISIN